MKISVIIGAISVFVLYSCAPKAEKNDAPLKSGIRIENGVYRGTTYTDPKGMVYNLRYMPITLVNENTVSIQLEFEFLKQYVYPITQGDQMFRVIPLPTAWALNGVGITESMFKELPRHIDNPNLEIHLEPGADYRFAIGTLYPRPANFSGVRPMELFTTAKMENRSDCPWLINTVPSSHGHSTLALQLTFGENCRLIPCGQILLPGR